MNNYYNNFEYFKCIEELLCKTCEQAKSKSENKNFSCDDPLWIKNTKPSIIIKCKEKINFIPYPRFK